MCPVCFVGKKIPKHGFGRKAVQIYPGALFLIPEHGPLLGKYVEINGFSVDPLRGLTQGEAVFIRMYVCGGGY